MNVDITSDTNPDVVHDLDEFPWPFPDDRFAEVRMIDVLEHLREPHRALHEIHRITTRGGTVEIVCPHFSSANAYTDITHRNFLAYGSFDTITGDSVHSYYTRIRFAYAERRIMFYPGAVSRAVSHLANRWPERYERRWAWIFPAWFMRWRLEVVKAD